MIMCVHPDQRGARVIERSHRRHARIDAPLDAGAWTGATADDRTATSRVDASQRGCLVARQTALRLAVHTPAPRRLEWPRNVERPAGRTRAKQLPKEPGSTSHVDEVTRRWK